MTQTFAPLIRCAALPALLAATLTSGCSALIDTDPYQAGDAGVDASVDPNAPTMPSVTIEPAAPAVDDDLTTVIVTESTDPLDAGPVTYEYSWTQNGADTDVTDSSVDAALTATGDTWEVRVTPLSADGSRRGAPGIASVTLVDQTPTVGFVRLSEYRPILGTRLEAVTGGALDPDGDATSLAYAWSRNGEPIDGASSARITLSDGFTAGDEITVEVTISAAGAEGNSVSAGPAIVVDDVTRWRQLTPELSLENASLVQWDPKHDRTIIWYSNDEDVTESQLWEATLDASGDGMRFTELFPTGSAPTTVLSSMVYDPVGERMLVLGGLDFALPEGTLNDTLYALDMSQPGSESWSEVPTSGDPIPGRLLSGIALDETRNRLLVYGGFTFDEYRGDLWSLDLTPGAETWTMIDAGPDTARLGAALIVDEARDRLIIAGGGEEPTSGSTPVPLDEIWTGTLSALEDGFSLESSVLPRNSLLSAVTIDEERGRAILAYGLDGGESVSNEMISIDLETLAATALVPSGPTIEAAGGFIAPLRDGSMLLQAGDFFDDAYVLDFYAFDPDEEALTPLLVFGEDTPRALHGAIATGRSGFQLFGGRDDRGDYNDQLWRLEDGGTTWTTVETIADPLSGNRPSARRGIQLQSGSNFGLGLTVWGGDSDDGQLGGQAFSLREEQWIERTLAAGETAPSARTGVAIFDAPCGATQFAIFGGLVGTTRSQETRFLRCPVGERLRDCMWGDPIGALAKPPARAFATGSSRPGGGTSFIFGGEGDGTFLNDAHSLDVCSGGAVPWEPIPPESGTTPPPGRARHTMTRDNTPGAAAESYYIIGGQGATGRLGDVWRATFVGASLRWEEVDTNETSLPARSDHAAVYDRGGERILVYGGRLDGGLPSSALFELRIR